ncbi:hypothetical protein ACLOJK_033475 [Asimina triloba]
MVAADRVKSARDERDDRIRRLEIELAKINRGRNGIRIFSQEQDFKMGIESKSHADRIRKLEIEQEFPQFRFQAEAINTEPEEERTLMAATYQEGNVTHLLQWLMKNGQEISWREPTKAIGIGFDKASQGE